MKKYLLGITCLLLIAAICVAIPLIASEDFGPFKNKKEEQAAEKAAQEAGDRLVAEKAQRIAEEEAMTPEQKEAVKNEEKAEQEKKFLEEKANAEIEYDRLTKELQKFKDSHDMHRLTEDEYIELVTLQDSALVLYQRFLSGAENQTSGEMILSRLDVTFCYEKIESLSKQLEIIKDPYYIQEYQIQIRNMERHIDLAGEIRERLEKGENPEELIKYMDDQMYKIERMYVAESNGEVFDPDHPDNKRP